MNKKIKNLKKINKKKKIKNFIIIKKYKMKYLIIKINIKYK